MAKSLLVSLDPSGNTITFGGKLFKRIFKDVDKRTPTIFTFRTGEGLYGCTTFRPSPDAEMSVLMVDGNSTYAGYTPAHITVERILYDYGIDADEAVLLPVSRHQSPLGFYYYIFEKYFE